MKFVVGWVGEKSWVIRGGEEGGIGIVAVIEAVGVKIVVDEIEQELMMMKMMMRRMMIVTLGCQGWVAAAATAAGVYRNCWVDKEERDV